MILSRIRSFAEIVGTCSIHGCDGKAFLELSERICEAIGDVVNPPLPQEKTPYGELAAWISGTDRKHPIEIFTPNYDLLMEEAFERLDIPFFDGFSGSFMPFFDPISISNNDIQTAQDIGDPQSINEDLARADEATDEDIENDWLNDINDCE